MMHALPGGSSGRTHFSEKGIAMNNQEIFELMDRFAGSGLRRMKLSREGFSIELESGADAATPCAPRAAEQEPHPAAPAAAAAPQGTQEITAPLAGIFYAAPAPDQPPFVTAGTRVKQGETICLLEAMKIMSEVPAPCDCVIDAVLKENGELAAFGEPLFRYRPC